MTTASATFLLRFQVVMRVYGLSKASVCRYLAQARFLDAEAAD